MAVRRSADHRLGGEVGAGARPVLDENGLGKMLRQPMAHQARESVAVAPGGKPTMMRTGRVG